jgi:hypothetical protein
MVIVKLTIMGTFIDMVKCFENQNISVYKDFKAESENTYNINNSICYEQNIYVKKLLKKNFI